ncbi:MAG TPA: hypothetical protein VEL05_03060 [Candidatus Acidoferrum sp.]|nr:hypothetical protein [Candidatus Acidoferrum sp.]
MKESELPSLEDRLQALAERLEDVEDSQTRAGEGMAELGESVRDLAQSMRRRDRVLSLNSFVAYLLFTVLLCATFFLLFRGRADDAAAERDRALGASRAAQSRAEAAARQLASRDAAERASAHVLELLRQHRYREAIAAHHDLAGAELGAAQRQFLADAVQGARAELVAEAALLARQAFDRHDFERVREVAEGGVAFATDGDASAELRYLLAASLDRLGRTAEAQAAYAAFVAAAPDHELALRARQRLERITHAAQPGDASQ